MRGLWHDIMPFATDTNGACSVFKDTPALIIPQDSNGSSSTLRKLFGADSWTASVTALNLIDNAYALGREDDFQDCMADLDERSGQEFVLLVHGPVSRLLGMDLRDRAELLQRRLGKPVYYIETSGNEFYDKGLALAYDFIWRTFAAPAAAAASGAPKSGCNLLGLNYLDHPGEELRSQANAGTAAEFGNVTSTWGSDSDRLQWEQAATAATNVVCSASAVKQAKLMETELGQPWVALDTRDWFDSWAEGLTLSGEPRVLVIGEQITSGLLRRLLLRMGAASVHVASFFTMERSLRQPDDVKLKTEGDLKELVGPGCPYDLVICDGTFARFCSVPAYTLTHLPACFGRMERRALSPQWLQGLTTAWNETKQLRGRLSHF